MSSKKIAWLNDGVTIETRGNASLFSGVTTYPLGVILVGLGSLKRPTTIWVQTTGNCLRCVMSIQSTFPIDQQSYAITPSTKYNLKIPPQMENQNWDQITEKKINPENVSHPEFYPEPAEGLS